MDQNYKKRINNLQFSICSYLGNMPENPSWEVRLYYPNSYYGRESDFIKDGDYYRPNDSDTYRFVRIHKDCFKKEESCYTLAIFNYDSHEDFWELHFVGDRPLDLNEQERQDFWKVVEIGYKYLNEFKEENE